jgi:hypothetical protein
MRTKSPKIILTFRTNADAMACEAVFNDFNIGGRFIPVPQEISAGCGLAWCMSPEEYKGINESVLALLPKLEKVTEVMMY